jgi:hypothetical protein
VKKLFWIGLTGLILFEVANVYFIMPMPGSQQSNSIDLAYFLYKWRWIFRGLLTLILLIGLFKADWHPRRKWLLLLPIALLVTVVYMANFKMAADAMFRQPGQLLMVAADKNKVDSIRLVIGVTYNGESKAYPVQYIGYHHHVQDTVGGKPILVTYCTVCRTGRVFEPIVNGKHESFRLVGMDHFNAMLEDKSTGSWWRQVSGEAIAGKLKGQQLPEFYSTQTSLAAWIRLHPNTLIMQADPAFKDSYPKTTKYEDGTSRDKLTGTDSLPWNDKSWVIGVKIGDERKAYDWNRLVKERIIQDYVNETPLVVVLSNDNRSFFALKRPHPAAEIRLGNDELLLFDRRFKLDGNGIDTSLVLTPLPAYQEFWHSWRTFNPDTKK